MVVDGELVAAAREHVMNRAYLVLRAVIDMQLGKEAAAAHYLLATSHSRTLTFERTLQLHHHLTVRTGDRHIETAHVTTALARKTVRVLTRMEVRLLVAATLAVRSSQINIVLVLRFKARDQLKSFDALLDVQASDYIQDRNTKLQLFKTSKCLPKSATETPAGSYWLGTGIKAGSTAPPGATGIPCTTGGMGCPG